MSVNFDSTFGFDPAVQDSSMAARGLYATMVTWCDHQIYTRPDSFDGTFDLKRVRSLGGTVRLVRELVENGLFEEAGEGVYRVVTRRGLAVFGSFKNQKKPLTPEEAAELHEKKVIAGHAGGKASGESRRAKAEANRKQNEADAKQTASTSTKQTGSTTVPNQTKTMPSSSPDPSGPGSKQTASVAEAEAREQGIPAVSGKCTLFSNARTIIEDPGRCFMKLVARTDTHELIGAQLMCKHASDMISQLSTAMVNRLTVEQLLTVMRPHPSFEEALGEAVENLASKLA